ncbi:GIY-YIG nuclease family protein [Mangrovicella endophytica]|uniref:GIY-YIG nuclease family protein n=1 Tax=Mangrovicella endophytica TaxID=2066697 RepID=UPI000C9E10A6|nr:GIY-YIG nuclease family protein [Mangrovicella endophytica]
MKAEDRKAATSAYKERKVEAGIYAVRCAASGEVWVGGAPDLSTIQNRLWFTLRQGVNTHRSLQSAWAAHGAEAFGFEVVERLDEETIGYVRKRIMKECLDHWAEALGAVRI